MPFSEHWGVAKCIYKNQGMSTLSSSLNYLCFCFHLGSLHGQHFESRKKFCLLYTAFWFSALGTVLVRHFTVQKGENDSLNINWILFIFKERRFIFKNIIYCQIGFRTTPSAHPNKCPPPCPSPTFPSPPPDMNWILLVFIKIIRDYIYAIKYHRNCEHWSIIFPKTVLDT